MSLKKVGKREFLLTCARRNIQRTELTNKNEHSIAVKFMIISDTLRFTGTRFM